MSQMFSFFVTQLDLSVACVIPEIPESSLQSVVQIATVPLSGFVCRISASIGTTLLWSVHGN